MKWRLTKLAEQCLPGAIAALLVSLLIHLGVMQPFEQLASNQLFHLRGDRPWDEQVVVIKIDDVSIRQLGRFPWPRQNYTQLLQVLSDAEAGITVINLLWSESSPDDPALARAMSQQGQVVLAGAWDSNGLPLMPTPQLQNAAIATGHILKTEGGDGIVRTVPAVNQGVPALSVAAVQAQSLVAAPVPLPDLAQPLQVNWLAAAQQIPSYSFVDVLQKKIPAQALRDKIVVVGVTATGFDPLITPYNRNPATHGVYLQATLINNLLQQNLLRTPSSQIPLEIVIGLALSWLLYRCRTLMQLSLGVGCSLAWAGVGLGLFQTNFLLPIASPILLFLLTTGLVMLYERLRINRLLQQQVTQLWQAHHQDLVLRRTDDLSMMAYSLLTQPISMQRVTQLAALAEQFGRSQSAQAAIARNLSIGLLAADLDGFVWFCNPTAAEYLQMRVGDYLQVGLVPHWLSEVTWHRAQEHLKQGKLPPPQEVDWGDRWFELRLEPLFYQPSQRLPRQSNGLLLVLEEITRQKVDAIAQLSLNQQLTDRTVQLELVNKELETFSYAVSHDLRAPLRRINGFSHILLQSYATQLDSTGQDYLRRIQDSANRMGELIEDLLNLSRLTRTEMRRSRVDLSRLVLAITRELQHTHPERQVELLITPHQVVNADERLLRTALENLLGNAWKYTSKRTQARIEFGVIEPSNANYFSLVQSVSPGLTTHPRPIYYIRDNGAGFDMNYASRLFTAFQRLHTVEEFPGTGVGLMTTQRIIHRHHGQIWAEGAVEQGATFYFTL